MDQVEQPETTPAIRSTFPVAPSDPPAPPDLDKVEAVVATFGDRFQHGPESDTGSDTGSAADHGPEPDPALAADADEDLQMSLPIARMIELRLQSFEKLTEVWAVEDRAGILSESGKVVRRVVKPTASKITYQALHATVYRYLEPLLELDQVAELLGVQGWQEEVARIQPHVGTRFRAFLESAVRKSEIQTRLDELIISMSALMRVTCRKDFRRCTNVRGTLAADEFEVRGVSDLVYYSDPDFILAAVVKSTASFSTRQFWYRRSRGTQVFNTLYSYKCPTLLVTQRHFKLFIENEARDRVYTFPAMPTAENATDEERFNASMVCRATANELYDILVMCLMRAHPIEVAAAMGPAAATQNVHPSRNPNVRPNIAPRRDRGTKRGSSTTANQSLGLVNPRFYTGEDDASGNPIYRTVHVTPLDQVCRFRRDGTDEDQWSSSEDEHIFARLDSGLAL